MLNYEEFKRAVRVCILPYANQNHPDAEVSVEENIICKVKGEASESIISLNQCYRIYLESRSLPSTIESICKTLSDALKPGIMDVISSLSNFSKWKDRITLTAVNYQNHADRLANTVHRRIGEFALYYTIFLDDKGKGGRAVHVGPEKLQEWGMRESQLFEIAMKNTVKENPPVFFAMENMLLKTQADEFEAFCREILGCDRNVISEDMFVTDHEKSMVNMYVLSTMSCIGGAVALFYPGVLQKIANQFDSGFYVIPSSVHECIIIPSLNGSSLADLRGMLAFVNHTELPLREQLSSNIYLYDKDTCELRLA